MQTMWNDYIFPPSMSIICAPRQLVAIELNWIEPKPKDFCRNKLNLPILISLEYKVCLRFSSASLIYCIVVVFNAVFVYSKSLVRSMQIAARIRRKRKSKRYSGKKEMYVLHFASVHLKISDKPKHNPYDCHMIRESWNRRWDRRTAAQLISMSSWFIEFLIFYAAYFDFVFPCIVRLLVKVSLETSKRPRIEQNPFFLIDERVATITTKYQMCVQQS